MMGFEPLFPAIGINSILTFGRHSSLRTVLLRKDPLPARSTPSRKKAARAEATARLGNDRASNELFELLRAARRELAAQQGVPPYIIFHDKTLLEMAELRPLSHEQLHGITGVGDRKLAAYGERLPGRHRPVCARVAATSRHCRRLPPRIQPLLPRRRQGFVPAETT